MAPNLVAAIRSCYRDGGIRQLATAAYYRLVPFRYVVSLRHRRNSNTFGAAMDDHPLTVYWVDPDAIRAYSSPFSRATCIGTVRGGDWDTERSELCEHPVYEGLRERFVDGLEWRETVYYETAKARLEGDSTYLGYTDLETFERDRLPYLEQLYESLAREGYKTQAELAGDERDTTRHDSAPAYHLATHEIGCNVARDGTLLLNTGFHRLSLAKILDLEEIPIQIVVRHERWRQTCSTLAQAAKPTARAAAYGLDPAHPDLESIVPASRPNDT